LSISADAVANIYGIDEYILARDLTRQDDSDVVDEVDLFARVR
jgi:hypothetical protein